SGRKRPGDPAPRENVADFPDPNDRDLVLAQRVENGPRWEHRKIVPVRGAPKMPRLTKERSSDDTSDAIRIGLPPGDLTNFIEPLERNDFLVRGDLQNRIG